MSYQFQDQRLIEQDLQIVKRIAGKFKRNLPLAEFDDMYQDGCIGLLSAYENWNDQKDASFETYAGIRVRGEILDGLRRLQWQSRSYSRGKRRIAKARRCVESRLLRKASSREIANELGVPITEYFKITDGHYKKFIPLNFRSDEDSITNPIIELRGATPGIDVQIILQENGFLVQEALAKINGRRKLVLDMYVEDNMSESTIGVVLGVSESRICQILKEAVDNLKTEIEILKNAQLKMLFRQLEDRYQQQTC